MTLELSDQETNILLQLIHIAVQARGMEVAEASVVLTRKIQAAQKASQTMQMSGESGHPGVPAKINSKEKKPNGHQDNVDSR